MTFVAYAFSNTDQERPEWNEDQDGVDAVTYMRVDTGDPVAARNAAGIPVRGSLLGGTSTVTLRRITVTPLSIGRELGRGINPASASTGCSRIRLDWSSKVNFGAIPKPNEPGQIFTLVQTSRTQQTVYYGQDRETNFNGAEFQDLKDVGATGLAGPINDGDGVGINVSKMEVMVVRAYAATNPPDYAAFVPLFDKINRQSVTLPAIYGSTQQWTAAVGQLLYVSPEIEPQGDIVTVKHRFEFAPDHWVRYQTRKGDGTIGRRYTVRTHDYADLRGLVS